MNFPPLTRIPALRALGAVCLLFAARPAIYAQLPGEAVPVITWPTPGAIVHGTALSSLQLDASANVPGSFSYSPAAGTVLPLGNNVLRVIFSPHDSADYVGTTASVTLQVDPPLAITWSSPAMIAYGTPLSALQLDASANAAGSFSYNPSAGTVLAEGGHTLTATFTPADTAIFATTTASVVLYVTALPLFYVSNGSGDTILEITSDGTSSTFISGFDEPNGLAADASGNLYVASGDGNLITKIPPSGSVAAGSTFATGMSDPVGLAFDQSGNLYVANFGNDTISKVAANGNVSTFASGLSEPVGLAFDRSGNLYVSSYGANAIFEVTPSGGVSTFASGLNQPAGLAFDGSGNLYSADSGDGSIDLITPAGAVSAFASVGDNYPTGLAFDSAGNLYSTDAASNIISEISPGGVVSNFVGDGLATPFFITAIPTAPPVFVVQPASATVIAGQTAVLVAAASGLPGYQWSFNGSVIPGATGGTLTLTNSQLSNGGIYSVTATNAGGSATSTSITLTIVAAPAFTLQPVSVTMASGRSAAFSAAAGGVPTPTYQWSLNGVPIPEATDPVLLVGSATAADAGTYTCEAINSVGDATSNSANLTVDKTGTAGYLTNISARADVGLPNGDTGPGILFGGFGIAGGGTKQVLIRGIGPGLNYVFPASFALSSVVADPILGLFSGPTQINLNDNWGGTAALINAFNQTGAFQIQPASLDAALLVSLPVTSFSAEVSTAGTSTASGTGLMEVYDADAGTPTARIVNLSARAFVGTGSHVLIGGFNIGGTDDETLLVRAVGPGLSDTFPAITNALAQPVLQIVNGPGTVVYSNTVWGGDATIASIAITVGAFPLNPAHQDSAALVSLPPGGYTVLVSGLNGGTGAALVELYDVP